MTTENSKPPADKKPPMAAAIRTFVAGMKFRPAPKHGSNHNSELAGCVIAMLLFANGIAAGSTQILVSPSVDQIAQLLHCSKSTVKRRLKALRDIGLLTQRERGHMSALYTFHQTPSSAGSTVDPKTAGSTDGTANQSSGIKSGRQRDQVGASAGSSRQASGIKSGRQRDQLLDSSGSSLGFSLDKNTSGSSLDTPPVDSGESVSVSQNHETGSVETLPAGIVRTGGELIMEDVQ